MHSEMYIKLLILALIGAVIGWSTNIIAIKLIFRPLQPVKVPLINLTIQGLIPKRREEIAKSIGNVIEEELLSIKDIIGQIVTEEDISGIKSTIKLKIGVIIENKLPAIIPSAFKNIISSYVEDIINSEGDKMIRDMIESMIDKATAEISLSSLVEEKINTFELEKIESIILDIAKKELKHIEILGGALGFIIGLIQGIIVIVF